MLARSAWTHPIPTEPPCSAVRTLIVDDYVPWRHAVGSILQSLPDLRVVGEASDGLEALQKVEELEADLVLLDIGLPGINGIEVACRIRQVAPNLKILFLSQDNDPAVVRTAMGSGALGYVLKFDAAKQLLLAVAAILQGYPFVSSGVHHELEGTNPA